MCVQLIALSRGLQFAPAKDGSAYQPFGSEIHPNASINARVTPPDSSSEPRQPSLLENKKNTELITRAFGRSSKPASIWASELLSWPAIPSATTALMFGYIVGGLTVVYHLMQHALHVQPLSHD